MLELLREEQGENQVTEEQDGQNQRNDSDEVDLHGLPQLLASLDVEKRQDEKNHGEQQHHNILHFRSRSSARKAPINMVTQTTFDVHTSYLEPNEAFWI
ncbi:MAG: hypothetical protein ABR956_16705 [Terracidiphilus sp.]|jgi:hypothetical protein